MIDEIPLDEIPLDIFLKIGNELCNNTNNEYKTEEHVINVKKTYEDYKNNYKAKLEVCISNNRQKIHNFEIEIMQLERKAADIIRVYSNKKFKSNSMNLIYTNKPIINYLMSLNSLDSEKLKYYELTIQTLKKERIFLMEILEKNNNFLSDIK